jgi:hypothetical protein
VAEENVTCSGYLENGKELRVQEDRQCTYRVTLRHVCATLVAVEK